MRKLLYIGISALLLVSGICRLNHWSKITYEPDPAYTEELRTRAARIQIRRDQFGVPYIHGKTRADAAFGLAYAHAEDDFPTIQTVLAASNGELARTMLSMTTLENDFYTGLTGTNLFQADHPFAMTASNAHAVSGRKSADGITRLNINSHQPWEGSVSSAINVYGASSREESVHYNDQMQLFSKRILRPVRHTQELLDYAAGYSYHPGEE